MSQSPRATARWTSAARPKVLLQRVSGSDDLLVLGPLLRHDDETVGRGVGRDARRSDGHRHPGEHVAHARTLAVHGHHYALVSLEGLEPGSSQAYAVAVDDQPVWHRAGSPFPAPVISTLEAGRPLRMAFGSCRTSVSHDEEGNRTHGVDALRAWALRLADHVEPAVPRRPRPVDPAARPGRRVPRRPGLRRRETTADMQAFIESRRDIEQPRRGRSSGTTRSTPTSTSWRGPTRPNGGPVDGAESR